MEGQHYQPEEPQLQGDTAQSLQPTSTSTPTRNPEEGNWGESNTPQERSDRADKAGESVQE